MLLRGRPLLGFGPGRRQVGWTRPILRILLESALDLRHRVQILVAVGAGHFVVTSNRDLRPLVAESVVSGQRDRGLLVEHPNVQEFLSGFSLLHKPSEQL